MELKITFTSSDGKSIVNATGPVSVSKLLSDIAGIPQADNEEEEEELIMCVSKSASLAVSSLRIVFIVSGLPAHLAVVGTFIKRPFCSLIALILPAGDRLLLLLGAPSLPSGFGGVPSVIRRRRLDRAEVDGGCDARAAAAFGAPVSN